MFPDDLDPIMPSEVHLCSAKNCFIMALLGVISLILVYYTCAVNSITEVQQGIRSVEVFGGGERHCFRVVSKL